MSNDDTTRLDWVLRKQPTFDLVIGTWHMVFWLPPSQSPSGVSGTFVATGKTQRECIDNAICGEFVRTD